MDFLQTALRWRWPLALASLLGLQAVQPAQAVPSYSRQTNSECAACHIGAFGPHLTPYGIRFKLGGYTDSDGKDGKIPLAATLQAASALTESGNPTTQGRTDTRLTNVDVFLAGRLLDNLGAFIHVAHAEGVAPGGSDYTQLDDVDLRFAKETRWGERDLLWGLSLNNHPGVQDPIDALPAWGFGAPGIGRAFSGVRTGSLLNKYQGGLAHRVMGLSGYAFIDNRLYLELGSYRSLSPAAQNKLGLLERSSAEVGDPGRLSNTLYWRGAWLHDMKTQFYSVGVFGLRTDLQPDRVGPSDRVNDIGMDASYMYLGTREHMAQLRASTILERRRYGSPVQTPPFLPPATSQPTGAVREATFSATYVYRNTWGITAARTWSKTQVDPALYWPYGKTDATFSYVGPYWNVWGKEGDSVSIGTNLQLGAAFYRFDRFNGSRTDIFGPGSSVRAKDLNSLVLYAKVAI